MRTITDYTKKPKAQEVIVIGDKATVFIRKSIKSYKDEEGATRYTAIEYSTQVKALGFKMSDDFEKLLIQAETDAEAARVRAKRNALLDKSDKEVMPDRKDAATKSYDGWVTYRKALRDIPEQKGFPFEVEWPVKPE